MVLRRIFGPRRDEVTGEWRRLHNELNDLYSSPNIVRVIKSRRMRWTGHVARMGEKRGVYRVLVGKPEGKRPLGRPRRRWVDNIRMDLQEVGCGYMDWIGLAQDRDGGCLWVRWWAFGFREMRGISWLAANQLASQEGLCAMKYRLSIVWPVQFMSTQCGRSVASFVPIDALSDEGTNEMLPVFSMFLLLITKKAHLTSTRIQWVQILRSSVQGRPLFVIGVNGITRTFSRVPRNKSYCLKVGK